MSRKPKVEDSAKRAAPKNIVPKRQPSKWEKERRRRRIIGIIISVVIAGVMISGGIVAYVELYRPWHQPVVMVNGTVYDMDYFVKMFRVQKAIYKASYGIDLSQYPDESQCQYIVGIIQRNELVRQKAEELSKDTEVDIMDITDDDINAEFQSYFGYDPDEQSLEEFNEWVNDLLENWDLSRGDFEKYNIISNILSKRVQEAMGNIEYPVGKKSKHVKVKAMLLRTEEEAEEVRGKWDEDFIQIINEYSPAKYYPQDRYWLVMVTEGDGEGEEGELYINAILLDSEENAGKVATEFNGSNFADLAKEYSLDSSAEDGGDLGWMSANAIEEQFGDLDTIQNLALNTLSTPIYGPIEWMPRGIEDSSVFEEYAFNNGNTGIGVSEPIRDTTNKTTGGYWLVMAYEPEEEEEQEEEGLYIKAILLDSREEAEKSKAEVEDEGDFTTLAQENSLDSSAADGGDMGWMSLEDIELKFGAGVLTIINDLGQDEISIPIKTTAGYWLVMVTIGDGSGEEGELYVKAMLLDSEEKAEGLKTEIEDGGDFATLAQENSLDSSAENGGDMGWMSQVGIESKFGAGVLNIINGLSQDEISTPIYDEDVLKQSGYWAIEVLDTEDRTLIEAHRDLFVSEHYIEWLNREMETGLEEESIKDYLDSGKISWAIDHI